MAFTPEQIKILQKGSTDFVYFVNNIFSKSVKHFIKGEHVDNTARFLSQHKRTIRVSARHHFKSFSFYAYFMWKLMYEGAVSNIEAQYFSFNADLAAYHIHKIKTCIVANPFFYDIIDKKPTAEAVLRYTWDNKHFTTVAPHGLIQFKRGIHADLVFVDDPFQDPENELNPTIIYKINEIFKSNILDMPKEPDGELHCAGTPQTNDDFFFDKKVTQRFQVQNLPAITEDGKALWPEWMDLKELELKREERTDRIFKREYLCSPVYSTKAFFDKDKFRSKVVDDNLVILKPNLLYSTENTIVAGFDIGKKTDPSHLSVFECKDDKAIMIHQVWMDGWPYSNGKEYDPAHPTQIEYLKMCIVNLGIRELHYDNTRGEFEALAEQNLLPNQMIPEVFTSKLKNAIATAFDRFVEKEMLRLPNDSRLINQICIVTDALEAIRTKEGHGDSFWSVCLALLGIKTLIGFSDDSQGIIRRKIKTGQHSIFAPDAKIPKGF